MKRNLTVQLDESTIDKARILAARQATSVSRLVAQEIARLVDEDDGYRAAKTAALQHLERGFHLGGGLPRDRDSMHDH